MTRILAPIALAALLAACATAPERINPAAYATDCPPDASTQLAALEREQGAAATADAAGVLLVGIPVGSLGQRTATREREQRIAELKACVR